MGCMRQVYVPTIYQYHTHEHRIRNRKAPFVFEVAVLELRGFIWIELALIGFPGTQEQTHMECMENYTAGY